MGAIKSKIFNYGHEHEADWPPQFPETIRGSVGYIDPITKLYVEGFPPNPNNQFGIAPMAIFDSMPPTYHERACRIVESRKEWERLDQETGSLTFGNVKESRKYIKKGVKEETKAMKKDRRKASEEAIKMVRANPKEINQKWQKHSEKQFEEAKKSGLDTLLKDEGIKI